MILGEKAGHVLVDIRRNGLMETLFDTGKDLEEQELVSRALGLLRERERLDQRWR